MSKFTNLDKGMMGDKEIYFEFDEMWQPLEKYVPENKCDKFMFMGYLPENKIYMYKHSWTRRYLNIDEEGNFYGYTGEDYKQIDKEDAIQYSLE